MRPDPRKLVICLPSDEPRLRVPASELSDQAWIYGGVRSLHELAFAAAASGRHVELRGWVHRPTFERLAGATGVSPLLADEPRRPDAGDIVVIPEGHSDPFWFATPWLSEARFVLMAMAPLGLLGWPFTATWDPPSPLTVPVEEVNRPEYFRAIAALGISIWTNSEVLGRLAAEHGIPAADIGNGTPVPFPEPAAERPVDVVWLKDNRWAPRAIELAGRLSASVQAIESADNAEVLAAFGRAKVLLYPARMEGESRVAREARAMGCVPVLPRGNPLAVLIEESDGVLAVESAEAIPGAIEALLNDPQRLAALSANGMSSARTEVSWTAFLGRVSEAIDALPSADPDTAGARGAIGAGIDRALQRVPELQRALAGSRQQNLELEAELERVRERNMELEIEAKALRDRKDAVEQELQSLRDRRAVRWSLAAAHAVRRKG